MHWLTFLDHLVAHWRRQLWGTGARAPFYLQLFVFLVTPEPHNL